MTIAKLTEVRRLPSSINGNPRYEGVFVGADGDGFTAATKPNAQLGYVFRSLEGKTLDWTFVQYRGRLCIESYREVQP